MPQCSECGKPLTGGQHPLVALIEHHGLHCAERPVKAWHDFYRNRNGKRRAA